MTCQDSVKRLYIHIPFCASKCGYCAFYSIPAAGGEIIEKYLRRLCRELEKKSRTCGELESVYVGGGTPSFLAAEDIERIFTALKANFSLSNNCEISIECNPETLNDEKISVLSRSVNRVSFGVQSFNERFRKILGRKGSPENLYTALELFRKNGLENFSCDLIHGIPGQTTEDYAGDLEKFLQFNCKHLSSYSLTFEEASRMSKENIITPDPETEMEMWRKNDEILSIAKIKRYEVSNFAAEGSECVHNLEIWFGDRYLGIGPSASSFDGKNRWTEKAGLEEWLNEEEPDRDIIPAERRAAEILAFGLRTLKPWTNEKFRERSGFYFQQWEKALCELEREGLITMSNGLLESTMKGLIFWNNIAEKIIN
jgi:oxygen-independent coproporphyrinogen-3 oxidase